MNKTTAGIVTHPDILKCAADVASQGGVGNPFDSNVDGVASRVLTVGLGVPPHRAIAADDVNTSSAEVIADACENGDEPARRQGPEPSASSASLAHQFPQTPLRGGAHAPAAVHERDSDSLAAPNEVRDTGTARSTPLLLRLAPAAACLITGQDQALPEP